MQLIHCHIQMQDQFKDMQTHILNNNITLPFSITYTNQLDTHSYITQRALYQTLNWLKVNTLCNSHVFSRLSVKLVTIPYSLFVTYSLFHIRYLFVIYSVFLIRYLFVIYSLILIHYIFNT